MGLPANRVNLSSTTSADAATNEVHIYVLVNDAAPQSDRLTAPATSSEYQLSFPGRHRVDASFTLALAAYNLIRLPRLLAEAPT